MDKLRTRRTRKSDCHADGGDGGDGGGDGDNGDNCGYSMIQTMLTSTIDIVIVTMSGVKEIL